MMQEAEHAVAIKEAPPLALHALKPPAPKANGAIAPSITRLGKHNVPSVGGPWGYLNMRKYANVKGPVV